jgi:hypothetical protein
MNREATTAEGRALLLFQLGDDEARYAAIRAIGDDPWPGALPALIEVAEGDERAAMIATLPIARAGCAGGPKETGAAVDFLFERLDDEVSANAATRGLFLLGRVSPLVARLAERFASAAALGSQKTGSSRKIACLCLLAASDESDGTLAELARSGPKVDLDAARRFLQSLLEDADERIRAAATRTSEALGLRS